MAAVKRQVNEAQDALEVAAFAAQTPVNLPAVIPIAPAPVALGTLQAATPGALVQGAADIAAELAHVIDRQNLTSVIQGRKHVRVEGWTTLGIMLGVVAREVSTTETDGVYTSTVELVRMSDGACLSRASAECGADDEKDRYGKPVWANRPRYARRSMAQTRATGKACRLAFSWIMSLAGYEPTPAEEMPPPTETAQEQAPAPARQQRPSPGPEKISLVQHRQLEAKIGEYGLDRERVKSWIFTAWHIEHFPDLHPVQFERLLVKLERWAAEEYARAATADAATDDCPF